MAGNEFASINRHPNAGHKNEGKVNFKPQSKGSSASAATKQRSPSAPRRFFRWCTQCCRRCKDKKVAAVRSQKDFLKRMKKKATKHHRKKKSRSRQRDKSPISEPEEIAEEIAGERRRRREKGEPSKQWKRSRERKRSRQREKEDPLESPLVSGRRVEADEEEKFIRDHILEKDFDFTKSCCYLCAKNTLAIAGAISKVQKAHVSIQASTHYFREDKSCSPEVHVRTVKSSVKVKMRDMSTLHPEKKKPKKPKFKLKLKPGDIIDRIRLPIQPKVRTVACETDKSVRNNNVPPCRARHGTRCVTEKK